MSANLARHLIRTGLVGLCLGLLGSCVAVPPHTLVATVRYPQGEAYVIRAGSNATPAFDGELLYDGDGFSTGSGTMQLIPVSGGSVDVYPGTDPIIEKSFCFAIRLFSHGGMHVNGHGICVDETLTASNVGYDFVAPGVMEVWVLEGQVRLLTPPFSPIGAGQRVQIQNGVIISRSTFTPAEFARRFPPIAGAERPLTRIPPVQRPIRLPPRQQQGPVVG